MNPIQVIEINYTSTRKTIILLLQTGLLSGFLLWFGAIVLLLLILLAALYFRSKKQYTHILLDSESKKIFLYHPEEGWQPASLWFACSWWITLRAKGKTFVVYHDMIARENYHYCLTWLLVHGANTVGNARAKFHG
jgi:hypothetical protein